MNAKIIPEQLGKISTNFRKDVINALDKTEDW